MLPKGNFVKDAATLTLGTTIAQVLPIIIYPILGRIYTPADFALLASFTSIVSIFQVISTGKYEGATLIVDDDNAAANVVTLALGIGIVSCVFFTGILFIPQVRELLSPNLGLWVFLIPAATVFVNIYEAYNEWSVRKKRFKYLSYNKITYSATTSIGKLSFAKVGLFNSGLLTGDILGKFLTSVVCVWRIWTKDKETFKDVSYPTMKHLMVKYRNFPMFTMPAQLLNTIGAAAPVLILNHFFNSTEVGFYSMTYAVLTVPISIISYSVRDVFRQKANMIYKETGQFRDLYVKVLKKIAIMTAIVAIGVFWILPWGFGLVLGEQWRVSGEYAQLLLPMIAVDFIAMSFSGVFVVTQHLKALFNWQLIYCFSTIGSLLIGSIFFKDIKITLLIFSFVRLFVYGYMIALSYKFSYEKN